MKKFHFFLAFWFFGGCSNSIDGQVSRVYFSEQDKIAILNTHNSERKLVGNSDLIWDNSLEEFAANWASTLAYRDNGLSHRPNNRYGENCYWTGAKEIQPEEAILAFNEEKHDYNYGPVTASNYTVTGHYTQVIWYRTTRVGCAAVTASSGIFVVCNYDPPGNLIGDYPYGNSIRRENNTIPVSTNQNNNSYPIDLLPTKTESGNSNNIPLIKSGAAINSNVTANLLSSPKLVYFTLFSGAEVWTKFESTPVLPRLKSFRNLDFTGSSPSFVFKLTLPRGKKHKERNVRSFVSMGLTLNNHLRQKDLRNQIQNYSEEYRVYSAINYELGLQFFKYCDLGFGQLSFGNITTSNTQDHLAYNRVFLRCALPLGDNVTIVGQMGLSGVGLELGQWNMALFNMSLRSRFF